jgi:hypothetical protein
VSIWDRAERRVVRSEVRGAAEFGLLSVGRAATDPNLEGSEYLGPGGVGEYRGHPVVVPSSERSHDAAAQQQLWAISEKLTGVVFPDPRAI